MARFLNICRGCDQDFASVEAFDRHRVGVHEYTFTEGLDRDPPVEDGRRCLDAGEMREASMSVNGRGRWQIDSRVARARDYFTAPALGGATESDSEPESVPGAA